jgi:hypothetical protein
VHSATDQYKCPFNNKTGQSVERTITYNISCNPLLPIGQRTSPLLLSLSWLRRHGVASHAAAYHALLFPFFFQP